ncbi:winged helix DNA-binding protein [Thermosporothrix hazakensis]|jgi:hypothetical protein|uniref:Winged helix DNA-binding protein n=1 Tax=Thermosporothrix hazakensis TaxID=644383 RepID=A0A326UBM1_THEHA|nr:winged helix DNA-binding domain-containing protein [Thermosporothrix hazakensis]PZW31082.1 winged helix DNA-binding protein [Thermosporothrix hazakensis]GCE51003.1 hypothetical protein KTH_58720 [Thermosporothrix hazakensis]
MIQATRTQALAFRLSSQNLLQRKPVDSLLDVAAVCGIRNTPPGSALLAFHARLEAFSPDALQHGLLEVYSVRSSPFIVPAQDMLIFTLGALPADDASLLTQLVSLAPALQEARIPATAALEMATQAAIEALGTETLSKAALSQAITRRIPETLSPWCRPCNAFHVNETLFRLAGVNGAYVIAPRAGRSMAFQHLEPDTERDRVAARQELLRRYLRAFGPSTSSEFARWVGISVADAEASFQRLAEQLIEVALDGRRTWLHADDRAAFEHPTQPEGVRLLPAYDIYLDQPDRSTLVPELAHQKRIWKALGNPGVVLADGEIVATWRGQKKGKRLLVTVEPLWVLSLETQAEIEAEASQLAPYRDCTTVEVTFHS